MDLDWQKEADYAYCGKLSSAGWAFEFLRRNPEYRADYALIQDLRAALTKDHGPYAQAKGAWRADPRAWIYVPPREIGESLNHWRNRAAATAGTHMIEEWYVTWYRAKWKLKSRLPDPRDPAEPRFQPLAEKWPLYPTWGEVGEFYRNGPDELDGSDWWASSGYVVAVFDLTVPVNDQLKALKAHLQKQLVAAKADGLGPLKLKKPGSPSVIFRTYLRALDAAQAGVAEADMGKVLFPAGPSTDFNTKKAWETLHQARNYVKSYRAVAFMPVGSD